MSFHINMAPIYSTNYTKHLNKSRTNYYVTIMCDVHVIVVDHVTTISEMINRIQSCFYPGGGQLLR